MKSRATVLKNKPHLRSGRANILSIVDAVWIVNQSKTWSAAMPGGKKFAYATRERSSHCMRRMMIEDQAAFKRELRSHYSYTNRSEKSSD
jgi:hypothetical protein